MNYTNGGFIVLVDIFMVEINSFIVSNNGLVWGYSNKGKILFVKSANSTSSS